MSLQDRIEALKAKHAALEARIEAEHIHSSAPDDLISDLKRQKLKIKDELAALEVS